MNIVLAFVFYLIAIVTGWLNRQWLSVPFRLALLHVFIALLEESVGWYISHYLGLYNIWLYNLVFLFEIWLIGFIVLYYLRDMLKLIVIVLSIISLVWFYQAPQYFFTGLMNYSWALEGMFVVCFFPIILIRANTKDQKFFLAPETWLCLGYMIFWVGNIPMVGIFNYEFLHAAAKSVYRITHVLVIIYSLCISISFWMQGRKAKLYQQ